MNVFNGRKLLAQCFWQATGDFVLTDADGFRHILQCVLGNKVVLALTEQQPDRGIVLRVLDDALEKCFQSGCQVGTDVEKSLLERYASKRGTQTA